MNVKTANTCLTVLLLVGGLVLLGALPAQAATFYVTAGSAGGSGSGTVADPFTSIQQAVNAVAGLNTGVGNNAIYVAAGAYNEGQEESLTTLASNNSTADGLGSGTVYSKLDSMALINVSADADLTGLVIRGGYDTAFTDPNFGTTTLDATHTDTSYQRHRVMYIAADNVHVSGLTLTGGELGGNFTHYDGAAALIHGDNVVFENVRATGNTLSESHYGAIIATARSGGGTLAGANPIFRNIEIDHNTGNSGLTTMTGLKLANSGTGPYTALVANVYIHDNAYMNGVKVWLNGGGADNVVIFGSLIEGNDEDGVQYPQADGDYIRMVNNTIADNGDNGFDNGPYDDHNQLLNNIFSQDASGIVTSTGRPIYFAYNLIDETLGGTLANSGNYIDGYTTGVGDDGTNDLTSPPGFTNQGSADYTLLSSSAAIDAGAVVDAATYKYVDVDQNGSYTAGLDIIVQLNGYTPSASDWVVTTDLAGNPRLNGASIDLGAYEYAVPEPATLAFLAAGGLAMAGAGLRRRRRA